MSALITLSKHFSSSVGYTALSHLEQGLLILKKKTQPSSHKKQTFSSSHTLTVPT
jgi:hypothetical protein